MDPILEVEEEEESTSPYSPPMVTPMAQESEQISLSNILHEMEVSKRETFDQLRVDRRQSKISLQEHIQRLELREDERRRRRSSSDDSSHGGRRRRHGHDGGEGAINSHKDNLHQSKFQSSKERMIQTSTLNGSKKWTKFLTFI